MQSGMGGGDAGEGGAEGFGDYKGKKRKDMRRGRERKEIYVCYQQNGSNSLKATKAAL